MAESPPPAPTSAGATDPALVRAREHLGRLGYDLVEEHRDARTGARLLVLASREPTELLFCELRAERVGAQNGGADGLRRRRLRRAALAWLRANDAAGGCQLRFDRLTVFVGRDGLPIGLEYQPQAF
jgi:Holliday junction resolvase-like predicted endonuclease